MSAGIHLLAMTVSGTARLPQQLEPALIAREIGTGIETDRRQQAQQLPVPRESSCGAHTARCRRG
jgi:hypothetical protein